MANIVGLKSQTKKQKLEKMDALAGTKTNVSL